MKIDDIDAYLKGFGISRKTEAVTSNSKRVYVKKVLGGEDEEIVIKIADDLEIEHPFKAKNLVDVSDSRFWIPNHFRLFLRHISSFKETVVKLQIVLKRFGISSFFAHTDIEPSWDWQDEIEKALFSMDALAAILMPVFHESYWTDQEVGVAIGRSVPVISICKKIDPYGFIGRYQCLKTKDKSIKDVASDIFSILISNKRTKGRMLNCLVDQLLTAPNLAETRRCLNLIERPDKISRNLAKKISENISSNQAYVRNTDIQSRINKLLEKNGFETIIIPTPEIPTGDDPF